MAHRIPGRSRQKVRSVVPLEKHVQSAIKKLLGYYDIAVYDTSQPFRAAVTPGVPDLLCFCTTRGFFVIECKSEDGRQSKAQREFQSHCEAAGVPYVLGGIENVATFLRQQTTKGRVE